MDFSDTTVIIPVKDEPGTETVAKDVLKSLPGSNIIVIYKGAIKMALSSPRIIIVKQTGSGKGTACIQAFKLVRTPIVCLIDGDGTYSAKELGKLIRIVRHGADMALGDRMERMKPEVMPGYIRFGNDILTATANLLYGMDLRDSQTGLRAIRKKALDKLVLHESGFSIEEEINIKMAKKGYKISQAPISYAVRMGEAKHMKLSGGLKLLFANFKFIFDQ